LIWACKLAARLLQFKGLAGAMSIQTSEHRRIAAIYSIAALFAALGFIAYQLVN